MEISDPLYKNNFSDYADRDAMHKLPAVEEAKALFEEAKDWGVWSWLTEKRKLRQTADAAWAALEDCESRVRVLLGDRPGTKAAIQNLKPADRAARKARMDAEAQFDEADRRMSTQMAREGAQMAIDAWTLREQFIRKLESLKR
jgi:hypothetical protein